MSVEPSPAEITAAPWDGAPWPKASARAGELRSRPARAGHDNRPYRAHAAGPAPMRLLAIRARPGLAAALTAAPADDRDGRPLLPARRARRQPAAPTLPGQRWRGPPGRPLLPRPVRPEAGPRPIPSAPSAGRHGPRT